MSFVDVMQQMRVALEGCLKVKPGEQVLIITDTHMSDNIKTALMAGLNAAGAEPLLLTMTTRRLANQEVPELIAKAMKDADAIIPVTSISMVHTNAMKGALEAKKRLLGMILMTEEL